MKIVQLFFFIACGVATGCKTSPEKKPSGDIRQYLQGDTSTLDNESLEALHAIKRETSNITEARNREVVPFDSVSELKDPVFSEKMTAAIAVRFKSMNAEYSGEYKEVESTQGKISGVIADGSAASIYYRLPGNKKINLQGKVNYQLQVEESAKDGSMQRVVMITDNADIRFIVLEQGSTELYKATFASLNLEVRQQLDKKDYVVQIILGKEKFVLRPGDSRRANDVEFYLASSTGTTANPATMEGLPYFIRLYVWR